MIQFFIIGPLRTGSSLLARCIDDHEHALCLCETEISRTLFPGYYEELHRIRMDAHGVTQASTMALLKGRRRDDVAAMMDWYETVRPAFQREYGKPNLLAYGDKSPDFYKSPDIVAHFAQHYRLIYCVRDPRAVVRSILQQEDATSQERETRWSELIGNIAAWQPHWDKATLFISRYEDLMRAPYRQLQSLYAFLGLPPSKRFRKDFQRLYPRRFLWSTSVDMRTGRVQPFNRAKAEVSNGDLPASALERLRASPEIAAYCERFGYSL
ncbi:MAG: sulfotransferase [Pseudomonadota bacterium]